MGTGSPVRGLRPVRAWRWVTENEPKLGHATRSPVLVHHPDDAEWFQPERILPDLPLEESEPWTRAADDAGVETIMLAAPTASDERLALVTATVEAAGVDVRHIAPLS